MARIDEHFTVLTRDMKMCISDEEGTELTVQDMRVLVSDPDVPLDRKDLCLRGLAQRSQDEGDPWTLAAVSVMRPRLGRIVRHLIRYDKVEAEDAESEVLTSFLQAVGTVDPGTDDLYEYLHRTTSRAARSRRRSRWESPVEDIELVGALRTDHDYRDTITEAVAAERSAAVRVLPSSRQQVEGERIGALLHKLGIREKTGTITQGNPNGMWN